MNDHRAEAFGRALGKHLRDVVPVGGIGDARAAEFEHKPLSIDQQGGRHVIKVPRSLTRVQRQEATILVVLEYFAQFLF
jgi:hypothetical protein